ncbi:hypothetical protein SDC9_35925 [bioreactor metagenome]|uniref:NAD-specific glutamate dehydrogenase n=1 Tax=bioreactor metagenome TaxID=1076179 RepID=A0A644VGY5_9ZZZZ
MRGGAELEGLRHAAKALVDLGGGVTRDLEGLVHDLEVMVADRARDQLVAVAGEVVLIAQNVERVALQCLETALRHREGVVREVDLAVVGLLVHREVDDPAEAEHAFLGQAKLAADLVAGLAGDRLELLGLAAEEEHCVALVQVELGPDRLGALGAKGLGDRAGGLHRTVLGLAPEDVAHAGQAIRLGEGVHPVTELAAAAGRRGNRTNLGALGLEQLGEDAKARVAELGADIGHLDRVAQVGLVRAVPQQRVLVGDLRPDRVDGLAGAEFLEHALHHRLHRGKDVFLLDEAHLDVELVEVGRAAVGARVLVAEAGRDLEVAVEARHHDQLLELLRRLRQGVELARVQARGHQEVTCALGRGGGDDRGLELVEARVPHPVAKRAHDVRAQDHLLVQAVAAQVEEAIGEAGFLGVVLIAEHRQRQLVGGTEDFHLAGIDLDLAGRDLRVDQLGRARLHRAVDADHPFGAHLLERGEGGAVAVADDLGDAVVVAQVDEQHAPVISHPVHPARETDGFAGIGGGERGAGMAAIGVHEAPLSTGMADLGPINREGAAKSSASRMTVWPDGLHSQVSGPFRARVPKIGRIPRADTAEDFG